MKTIIMLKGLPGSGKSTWAKELITNNPDLYKRVNKDDLRNMLDNGYWSQENEPFILNLRNHIIVTALQANKSVIVDDTNLHPKHEKYLSELAKEYQAEFEIKDFTDVPVAECIARDSKRDHPVGAHMIQEMYDRYIAAHDNKKTRVSTPEQPLAIVCDLDGTVALLCKRNPYDASTAANDEINTPIRSIILKFYPTHKIIFVSGREQKYEKPTIEFLNQHLPKNMPFDLYMRHSGDFRKDVLIKKEIYDKYIKNKFKVEFILDDRDQVVQMWRELGLTCLQVNYGDF